MEKGHNMKRRCEFHDYRRMGIYHITLVLNDRRTQALGRIVGDLNRDDDDPNGPHVALSAIGLMVQRELLNSISKYYPMVEIQDYVIMPDHVHFIAVVHRDVVSRNGRVMHLGHVIAGFKKGCNRLFWEMTGMERQTDGYVEGEKVPSKACSDRPPLFDSGYVDVMPLQSEQLEQQRQYIRKNPRMRLIRMSSCGGLRIQKGGVDTALTFSALHGYLERECDASQIDNGTWLMLKERLLDEGEKVGCNTYGHRSLLQKRLLPVVCHRKDKSLFERQKQRCLQAAMDGAVLVSARIAKGEQDIMAAVMAQGSAVIIVLDNGFAEMYHPSEEKMQACLEGRLLFATPWHYRYHRRDEKISVAECKSMNCIVQALCRRRDDWWQCDE